MREGAAGGRRRERGAAAVEMALVAPILVLLVFGVIEFGYGWSQQLNVRHGAREAGRLAAVNFQPDPTRTGGAQTDDLVAEACGRLDEDEVAAITISMPDGTDAGDSVDVTVDAQLTTLTGFFDMWLDDTVLSSTVTTRLERDATFAETTDQACP